MIRKIIAIYIKLIYINLLNKVDMIMLNFANFWQKISTQMKILLFF